MTDLQSTIYESTPETRAHVLEQLRRSGRTVTSLGDLHLVPGEPVPSYWHNNIWYKPVTWKAQSNTDVASGLRSLGALWSPRPQSLYRRHQLVQEKLPHFQPRPRPFPFLVPGGPIGAWALADAESVWASATTERPFPGSDPLLRENKVDPPSSAYRKLQEALLLCRRWPTSTSVCLDAGSSPGGWTWVLAELGAQVHSIDRAELDQRVLARPNVVFRTGNAFALHPRDFGKIDWLCSDVICYPNKLWTWIEPWIASGSVENFVVTIKMQGDQVDWTTLDQFASVPGSRLLHLYHNKHELTWIRLSPVDLGQTPAP